jgi:selenocysteine lyase/cysteine desulfurase
MAALTAAQVRAALRYGHIRLSPHLWTTDADVDRAIEALAPYRAPMA